MITHNLGRSLLLLRLYSPIFPVMRRNRVATICLETLCFTFSVFLDFLEIFRSSWGATFHLEKVRDVKRSTPRMSEKQAFSPEGP